MKFHTAKYGVLLWLATTLYVISLKVVNFGFRIQEMSFNISGKAHQELADVIRENP